MNWLNPINWITGGSAARMAVTLIAGALIGGTVTHKTWRLINDRQIAQQQSAALKAIEAAQAQTTHLQGVADAAEAKAAQRTLANTRAAAGVRTELERLRNAQRQRAAAALTCPATIERADTTDAVFSDCSAALADLARAADAHASDALRLWEAWPKLGAVDTPPP